MRSRAMLFDATIAAQHQQDFRPLPGRHFVPAVYRLDRVIIASPAAPGTESAHFVNLVVNLSIQLSSIRTGGQRSNAPTARLRWLSWKRW